MDSNTTNPGEEKIVSSKSTVNKESLESPSVLAISNLRCPSPPPILQHARVTLMNINDSKADIISGDANNINDSNNNLTTGTITSFVNDNNDDKLDKPIVSDLESNSSQNEYFMEENPSISKILDDSISFESRAAAQHAVSASMAAAVARDKFSS
ncbi:hypothetical protein C6P42_003584, partial [Pichia californica]